MRNPWGNVAFDDEFRIFHTDNDNEGTPDFTGCRLLHIVEGGDYGWRLREGARCCQPDPERATWTGGPPGRLGAMATTGRGAPAGLCVLNSAAFPMSTRNLLVYPDVFRKLVRAYKLRPTGATFTVAEEFDLLASNEGLFRPTDAEIGPDGALYILDWRTDSGGAGQLSGNGQTGRIYRLTWSGTEQEPARPTLPRDRLVGIEQATEESLIKSLGSEDTTLRRAASLELVRRGPDHDRCARLFVIAYSPSAPVAARKHALLTLSALLGEDTRRLKQDDLANLFEMALSATLTDQSPTLRRLSAELIGRFARPFDSKPAWVLLTSTRFDDPELRRASAIALGRFHEIRHARDGEDLDADQVLLKVRNDLGLSGLRTLAAGTVENKKAFEQLENLISLEMIANKLMKLAVGAIPDDPFLRDGMTRGLERLGHASIETLASAIKSDDPKRSEAALYALQGWRNDDGVSAILNTATDKAEVPATARVGLFRALRELIDSVPPDRVAQWLQNEPEADPSARVEAIHLLTAMHDRALLAASPIVPKLMVDDNADVRRAALALAVEVRSKGAREALVELVRSSDRPVDERRLALVALRPYEDKALAPMLSDLFATAHDAGLRIELLRTLAALDFADASERAEELLTQKDTMLRHEAIALLGQRPATARVVLDAYNAGKLPGGDLARVIEAVRPHASPDLKEGLQGLLRKSMAGKDAKALNVYVNRWGNTGRGKAIYLDAKKGGCAVCHRLEGVGGAVGPDLTKVYETLSFEKRVESILEPSKEIKEGFGTFKVATTDGRVISGLLLADTPEGVTLKDSEGREVRIPAKEIDEKGPDTTSLMPEGVVGHLSLGELADLLSFLGDRKAQESLRAEAP
jgi:putative heme-binding domain-containing protein